MPYTTIALFVFSLLVLVKSADWLLESAEKIGLKMGLSRFIVGALIVGFGTSLPELASSLAAVGAGDTTIVSANAVGSNIANILLVVGLASVFSSRLTMNKDLIELDLPMLVGSTALFIGIAWDQEITLIESVFLVLAYGVYFAYTIFHTEDLEDNKLPDDQYRGAILDKIFAVTGMLLKNGNKKSTNKNGESEIKITVFDILKLVGGVIGLAFGAKFLIDSVLLLSEFFNILPGVISLSAIALGTSLPELMVSLKASVRGHSDVAIGNIFGSNIFNILLVVGIPGLMTTLIVDSQTMFALAVMSVVTFLFVVSGLSRRLYVWEGSLFLIMYVLFMLKIFGIA
jgi:cation:H+ antiporter